MDEFTKHWFYMMWLNKQKDEIDLYKDFGCFIGSFWNPEAARKIQNNDGSQMVEVDDTSFDKALEFVENSTEINDSTADKKSKKRRKLKI